MRTRLHSRKFATRSYHVLVSSSREAPAGLLQFIPKPTSFFRLGTDFSKMFVKCQQPDLGFWISAHPALSSPVSWAPSNINVSYGRGDNVKTLVKICGTVILRWKYLVDTLGANLSRESRGVGDWRGNCVTSRRLLLPDTLSHRRCQPAARPPPPHPLRSTHIDYIRISHFRLSACFVLTIITILNM